MTDIPFLFLLLINGFCIFYSPANQSEGWVTLPKMHVLFHSTLLICPRSFLNFL